MGSFVATCGLSSCGAQAPERVGSVVVACGLCCPAACGILVPRPGIEPASPAWEGGFLTTGPPGKPPLLVLSADSHHPPLSAGVVWVQLAIAPAAPLLAGGLTADVLP